MKASALVLLAAIGPAMGQTADSAIQAHVRAATPPERAAIVDAVLACKSAFTPYPSAAQRGSDRCGEAVERWTMIYAGGVVATPGTTAWPVWQKLSAARHEALMFALAKRLSASSGDEHMVRGMSILHTVGASMSR